MTWKVYPDSPQHIVAYEQTGFLNWYDWSNWLNW